MHNIHNLAVNIHSTIGLSFDHLLKMLSLHVGEYKWSAKSEDFNAWLLCDGRAISKETYSLLYAVIGDQFGDCGEMFNLPDFRGKVMGCVGEGDGLTIRSMGNNIGTETHTLTTGELPSHAHTATTAGSGGHTHTATTADSGSHTHSGTTATNGLHSHENNAPGGTQGLAIADGTNTVVTVDESLNELNVWTTPKELIINNDGTHDHTFTTSANGTHSHAVTVASVADHTHIVTVNSSGSGDAHNNMQPTLFAGSVFIFSGYMKAPAAEESD